MKFLEPGFCRKLVKESNAYTFKLGKKNDFLTGKLSHAYLNIYTFPTKHFLVPCSCYNAIISAISIHQLLLLSHFPFENCYFQDHFSIRGRQHKTNFPKRGIISQSQGLPFPDYKLFNNYPQTYLKHVLLVGIGIFAIMSSNRKVHNQ